MSRLHLKISSLISAPILLLLLSITGVAKATTTTFSFACGAVNNAANCATGAAQFETNVTDTATGAIFEFRNIGSGISSITDIYFDDDPLGILDILGGATLTAGAGVSFSSPASPGAPPVGASGFDASYSADSDSPITERGINQAADNTSDEWLKIEFDYTVANPLTTYAMLIAALNAGTLNIALHAQAIGTDPNETSEWLYITPPSPVPVPAAVWLFGTALIGFIGFSRRTKV